MTIERAVLLFAGLMILASLALTYFVSPWWMLLTAFVGVNLIQSSFTGFCPAAMAFRKLGLRPGSAFRVGPPPAVTDPTVTPLRP